MATGSPSGPDFNAMDPRNPVFPEIFFFAFFASMDLLGPQGRPRMDRNHLIWIRIRIREIRFFQTSLKQIFGAMIYT